jgi:hypothetical protein
VAPVEIVLTIISYTASGGAMEAGIRIIVATLIGLVAFAAVSAEAAPLPGVKGPAGEPGACPPIGKVAQDRGMRQHNVPCDERWAYCSPGRCMPIGRDGPYRMTALTAQAVVGNRDENRHPIEPVWSFRLGDHRCGDGWHQALWLDWQGEWWWGLCVPNR